MVCGQSGGSVSCRLLVIWLFRYFVVGTRSVVCVSVHVGRNWHLHLHLYHATVLGERQGHGCWRLASGIRVVLCDHTYYHWVPPGGGWGGGGGSVVAFK